MLESLLVPTGIVTLAEIGDKTQLLALVLAARFRKPWPIIAGIIVATLANHFAAGALGNWVADWLTPVLLHSLLAVAFLAVAAWALIPDTLDEEEGSRFKRHGAFVTTLIAFFLAEMGDKTQIATMALAARFASFWPVVAGTTVGMLLANVPAVFFGDALVRRLPVRLVHAVAAVVFAALGFLALFAG